MRKFYEDIEHKKEQELLQDMQNRKHHDTLLPTQKSPIPLNRYAFLDIRNGMKHLSYGFSDMRKTMMEQLPLNPP